jgi:hypothetical protein
VYTLLFHIYIFQTLNSIHSLGRGSFLCSCLMPHHVRDPQLQHRHLRNNLSSLSSFLLPTSILVLIDLISP